MPHLKLCSYHTISRKWLLFYLIAFASAKWGDGLWRHPAWGPLLCLLTVCLRGNSHRCSNLVRSQSPAWKYSKSYLYPDFLQIHKLQWKSNLIVDIFSKNKYFGQVKWRTKSCTCTWGAWPTLLNLSTIVPNASAVNSHDWWQDGLVVKFQMIEWFLFCEVEREAALSDQRSLVTSWLSRASEVEGFQWDFQVGSRQEQGCWALSTSSVQSRSDLRQTTLLWVSAHELT